MQGTVNSFGYGLVTPVAAFLMACLGSALGLRCVVRSLSGPRRRRAAALVLGTISLGCGVWTMHFIAMAGFYVVRMPVGYDRPMMFASLAAGTLMIGIGLFLVGRRGATPMALVTGGTITGLGLASMHYLAMAGVELRGRFVYNTAMVVVSVAIGVVAATCALWTVARHRGVRGTLGAAACMGVAATGMHYAAMAALRVDIGVPAASRMPMGSFFGGPPPADAVLPLIAGPAAFLLLAGLAMLVEPRLAGAAPGRHPAAGRDWTGVPTPRRAPRPARRGGDGEASAPPVRRGSPDLHDW